MRNWRAEQCEDAVAGALHDVAVVAPHRIDHQLEGRIDDRARLLRIEILPQLGRTLDVGEERSNHLALSLQAFRRRRWSHPNLGLVRILFRLLRRRRYERCAALSAKLRARVSAKADT